VHHRGYQYLQCSAQQRRLFIQIRSMRGQSKQGSSGNTSAWIARASNRYRHNVAPHLGAQHGHPHQRQSGQITPPRYTPF